jgi:phosphoribosyl-AMP cyclohydrolase
MNIQGLVTTSVYVPNFAKRGGSVVAVLQDYYSGIIVGVEKADEEDWKRMLRSGVAVRSRPGRQQLAGMLIDCDGDALLCKVLNSDTGMGWAWRTVQSPKFEVDPVLSPTVPLVTAIAQDAESKEVLMVAYANDEALKITLEKNMATYYTTSRGKLWTKGEESGNFQKIEQVEISGEGSVLLYTVRQMGDEVACHTGARSCFYRSFFVGPHIMPAPLSHENTGEKEFLETNQIPVTMGLLGYER